ncbi:MMPL family transporter [Cohnella terricola]|uniref:MMPL family transporter n=1 Tax=Cohnella terricola TaxID=1289167 RepID=A0A559JND9_9BACL|nr:MMPL family transporter [Cohnella terricola]TVY01373.1 MMPL family transporter [Cohnella terricola]
MNLPVIARITGFFSSRKGAKIGIAAWLLLVIVLGAAAPGAKDYAISAGEGNVNDSNPSAEAQRLLSEHYPQSEGLPALLVFHAEGALSGEQLGRIASYSEWLASDGKPEDVEGAIPYHTLSDPERKRMISADGATLLLNVELRQGLESDRVLDVLDKLKAQWKSNGDPGVKLEMTGPAAISADTLSLFRNADFVLMIATVVLILVLLVAIYRSPLLAVIPLVVAGLVYAVVDKAIGLAGRGGLFTIDKQSLSIMMILLFAVITDYCLFVFSRYRERLAVVDSKYEAMGQAMAHVSEPILFSGGTVLVAMLALFAATFKPYHGFAPVLSIAVAIILLAGLTLIPAIFALFGRKAFWPFVPKVGEGSAASASAEKRRVPFWAKAGRFVTEKPKRVAGVLIALLLLASLNIGTLQYSFNLMKSFPKDTPSRVGFELLESRYPPGQLAPVSLIVEVGEDASTDTAFADKVLALSDRLMEGGGVSSVSPGVLSDDKRFVRLQVVLSSNPYEPEALDLVDRWRAEGKELLAQSGFDADRASLHIAGQTAKQADVRSMNERDTWVLFTGIALLILIMLTVQTRSVKMAFLMLLTILLSFAATLGLTWAVFHDLLGYGTFSYRMPVYTFVFMVALGVDYNIMLVSRIKEEAKRYPWKEAVSRGVASTGRVISSAGLILAATFGVLITQPMQELYLFGFAMAAGILIDTFLVRGMLLPSVLALAFGDKKARIGEPAAEPRSSRIRL